MENNYLSPREVAKMLGVSRKTIYDLLSEGKIKAKEVWSVTGNRRFWYIPLSEVEKLQKRREA